jgi:hypothetical protein
MSSPFALASSNSLALSNSLSNSFELRQSALLQPFSSYLGSAKLDQRAHLGDFFTLPHYEYDTADLYGPSGNPSEQDIMQNSLGDCYFVATLGAVADQQPGRIKNAISFDVSTGTFNVKMYRPDGTTVTIPVTQQDITDNKNRGGGSKLDNGGGPIWPAVMETAYAKMNDSNWSNGLAEGYNIIGGGGFADNAMQTVTGSKGTDLQPLGGIFFAVPTAIKSDILYTQISDALAQGKAVTLSTRVETSGQDGLVDAHTYIVDSVYKDASGAVKVVLRNPWGTNVNAGEGANWSGAGIIVDMNTLINTQGLGFINVGP